MPSVCMHWALRDQQTDEYVSCVAMSSVRPQNCLGNRSLSQPWKQDQGQQRSKAPMAAISEFSLEEIFFNVKCFLCSLISFLSLPHAYSVAGWIKTGHMWVNVSSFSLHLALTEWNDGLKLSTFKQKYIENHKEMKV